MFQVGEGVAAFSPLLFRADASHSILKQMAGSRIVVLCLSVLGLAVHEVNVPRGPSEAR